VSADNVGDYDVVFSINCIEGLILQVAEGWKPWALSLSWLHCGL